MQNLLYLCALDMNNNTIIIERNEAIQAIHKRIIHSNVNKDLLSNDTIVSIILEEPAPRFYISPAMAKRLILHHYNANYHINGGGKKKLSQAMVEDLVQNYERLCAKYPKTPKEKIYEYVVEQPAKSFYMSYSRMRDIIFNWRKCVNKRRR